MLFAVITGTLISAARASVLIALGGAAVHKWHSRRQRELQLIRRSNDDSSAGGTKKVGLGLAKTIYILRYIRWIYGIVGRDITIHTVTYGADIRCWPTLGGTLVLLFCLG
jgi:hypothetical protein